MLAGPTRIRLLRQLHDHPGQNIAALAGALGICRPYASQEMRRIQSRGLLKRMQRGASMIYLLRADPQVSSAAPLLKAVQRALDTLPPWRDREMLTLAAGLAHERRIAMAQSLMRSPKTPPQLRAEIPMARCSYHLHLRTLTASGFATISKNVLTFRVPAHPLAKALARLLQPEQAK